METVMFVTKAILRHLQTETQLTQQENRKGVNLYSKYFKSKRKQIMKNQINNNEKHKHN